MLSHRLHRSSPVLTDPERCRRAARPRRPVEALSGGATSAPDSRSPGRPQSNSRVGRGTVDAARWVAAVAFFGCLYYAALRPEEAISLAKHNLSLPKRGWGELHVERAEPDAGKEWTDSGRNRDQRPLKQRARGEVRVVPCPPALTALLHAHVQAFGCSRTGGCSSASATAASRPRSRSGGCGGALDGSRSPPRSPRRRWRGRPDGFNPPDACRGARRAC
jgi:hypothetical protein